MPEGPEMYRVAERIRRALGNQSLAEVWFAFDDLQSWSDRLKGQPLAAVETLGKALLLKFPDGTTIYTHNQLYGRWMFSAPDRRPDTGWRRRDYRHYVFGRDGQACFDCDGPIEKVTVGSRRLYFCSRCQAG